MTEVPLREYLVSVIEARHREVMTLLEERDRRLEERHDALEQAIRKAAEELQKKQDSTNEWRGTLNDAMGRFLQRSDFEAQHRALIDKFEGEFRLSNQRINSLNDRVIPIEARSGYISFSFTLSVMATLLAVAIGISRLLHG